VPAEKYKYRLTEKNEYPMVTTGLFGFVSSAKWKLGVYS